MAVSRHEQVQPQIGRRQFPSGRKIRGRNCFVRDLNGGIGVCSRFFFCDARRTPAIVGIVGSS